MRAGTQLARVLRAPVAGAAIAVADDVWVLRGGFVRGFNAYLILQDGALTLLDTGIKPMAGALRGAIAQLAPLRQIVLTHAHGDHRGCARVLGAAVLCHPDEAGDAEGDGGMSYMRLDELPTRLTRTLMPRLSAFNDGGPVRVAGTLREGDAVAGFEVVECAGHSPGHIALWRAADRLLIAGDAFMAFDLLSLRRCAPTLGPRAFIWNEELARASLRRLSGLMPATALPGHGPPITGDVAEALAAAARAPAVG
jgi:glyoxylase-like metal-dependent hydrolase (beta-lactamase superfamily II)